MTFAETITVPSNGTAVTLLISTPVNSSAIAIRNTGTVTVLLGPIGQQLFPLEAGEFFGAGVAADDVISAVVQTPGTAGQVIVFGMN